MIPLLLLLCQCGSFVDFSELPFDTKEYLIEYHTEGKGEDKVNVNYYNSTHVMRHSYSTGENEMKIDVEFGSDNCTIKK